MNGTQYRDLGLQELGMRQLRVPKRCGCGALTWLASKKHNKTTCLECIIADHKATVYRPFKALCATALLLLLLAGCQSAPKQADVHIKIAGQEVVMTFKK